MCKNNMQIEESLKRKISFLKKFLRLPWGWIKISAGFLIERFPNCVLLNKSNKKNRAECSIFGKRNGKCFLTKVLLYDIMLIQESRTMRFRILCCLEMSKKQFVLWRSPRIPHRRQRRVQFIIDTPIPDGISKNYLFIIL